MSIQLSVKHGPNVGQTYDVSSGVSVGSDVQNSIVVPNTAPQLFEVRKNDQDGYSITPLSSTPAVYVNGELLEAERALVTGDEIAIPPEIIYTFHVTEDVTTPSRSTVGTPPKQKNRVLPLIVGLILASGGLGLFINGVNRSLPVGILLGLLMLGFGIRQLYRGLS